MDTPIPQRDDKVLLHYTGERVPRRLDGVWASVVRGPIPGSDRIRVRPDCETDKPRKIEVSEIAELVRDGQTIWTAP